MRRLTGSARSRRSVLDPVGPMSPTCGMKNDRSIVPTERIDGQIVALRGKRVMLDRDLANLYGVTTSNLNKAVKRNLDRFPDDFMFQITVEKAQSLRFHYGILKRGQHYKYFPYAFPCKKMRRPTGFGKKSAKRS